MLVPITNCQIGNMNNLLPNTYLLYIYMQIITKTIPDIVCAIEDGKTGETESGLSVTDSVIPTTYSAEYYIIQNNSYNTNG